MHAPKLVEESAEYGILNKTFQKNNVYKEHFLICKNQ